MTGRSGFGTALVTGRKRVPRPAAGMTAFRTAWTMRIVYLMKQRYVPKVTDLVEKLRNGPKFGLRGRILEDGRARRGASGVLYLQSASAGLNSSRRPDMLVTTS